jgi:type IX secretion system PorP/SprF family membrane protein
MYKNINKIFLLLACALSYVPVFGQQDVQFSQYMFNGLYINPAYAGYREQWNMNVFYRQQWAGFPGAPKTFSAAADGTVNNKRVGLGIQLMNDQLGAQRTTALYASYAYRIPMDAGGEKTLALGISGGFMQQKLNTAALDETAQNDILFMDAKRTAQMPDVRVGVYYNSERFFAGLSADNLTTSAFQKSGGLRNYVPLKPHLYFTVGGLVPLSEEVLLKPSILLKEDFAGPTSMDINTFVLLSEKLWLGGAYRTALLNKSDINKSVKKSGALVGIVQFFVNENLRFGYAYDQTINGTGANAHPTHEFSIGYFFASPKARMSSPRYF